MRRMRTALLAVLAAAVVLGGAAFVASQRDDGDPGTGRPPGEGGAGEWVQVVGGGDTPLEDVSVPTPATDVSAVGIAAMAAAGDGTLWLVDERGQPYRVDSDGMIERAGVPDPGFDHSAGAALGPDGVLYVARRDEATIVRMEPGRRFQQPVYIPVAGLQEPIRGLHVGPDGQLYVADAGGGVYTVDLPPEPGEGPAEAHPVAGTPAGARCQDRTGRPPSDLLVGMAVDDEGMVVVADPHCEAVYRAGDEPLEAPDRPGCDPDDLEPGHVLRDDGRLIVVGASCRIVWALQGEQFEVLVEGDGTESVPGRSAAIDDQGNLYLTGPGGVLRLRLPG